MNRPTNTYLSKREQQIMEIVFAQERVTANEVQSLLPGSPSNSTVRTLLRILEEKGHLVKVEEEGRYVYCPSRSRQTEARSALRRLTDTLFRGSVHDVVVTLLDEKQGELTPEEIDDLQRLIDRAKEQGS